MPATHGAALMTARFDPEGALFGATLGAILFGAAGLFGWGLERGAAALWRWLRNPKGPKKGDG